MKLNLLDILRCPRCGGSLRALNAAAGSDIVDGALRCTACAAEYPVRNAVPRFVDAGNYAETFGFQWNRFARTQLDSVTGTTITRDRFLASTGWTASDVAGRRVLDVGCGAGRFTEVALSLGAEVVAVDYSSAVDACWANNGASGRVDVLQADVYHLPFEPGTFERIYCLGVLQHTPDVKAAFDALVRMLAPGGRLVVDLYERTPLNWLASRHWVRPFTKRMSRPGLLRLVETAVPLLLPLSTLVGRVPGPGRKLRALVPVSNYEGVLPLDERQLREWAILDTFDMLSPAYDQPQSAATLSAWFAAAGLEQVEIFRHGHLIGRGRRPADAAVAAARS